MTSVETFVPYEDFQQSAEVLLETQLRDSVRASLRVFNVVHEMDGFTEDHWKKQPVVQMWRAHTPMLYKYASMMNVQYAKCAEDSWDKNIKERSEAYQAELDRHLDWATSGEYDLEKPRWMGDRSLHLAHQAALIRIAPNYYALKFPEADPAWPLFWPVG